MDAPASTTALAAVRWADRPHFCRCTFPGFGVIALRIKPLGLWLLAAISGVAYSKDLPRSADLPFLGRYEGATINLYEAKEFDEARFLIARPDKPDNTITHEGKSTYLGYSIPTGRSSLEVFRNYQQSVNAQGFKPIFVCEVDACGQPNALFRAAFGESAVGRHAFSAGFSRNIRFGTYRLEKDGKDIALSIVVAEFNGANMGPIVTMRAVERKAMDTGKVLVPTPQEMTSAFATAGRIALYGLYFDTGLAVVKPESQPTLNQVVALLRANPKLSLIVVGHTDGTGDFQSNVELSRRRAAAVVDALTKSSALSAARLTAFGAGMAAPAVPNDNEANRAKNRRVELVPR